MKKIDVPLRLQAEGSDDCGPVCVQMVLAALGIDRELEDLTSRLTYSESGTSAYDNGILLLSEKLKVKPITAQPLLFSPDTIGSISSADDFAKIIGERVERAPADKPVLDTLSSFLKEGGEMVLEIPSFEHIQQAIDSSGLIIALLYGKALGSNEGRYHFVVIHGYDEDKVLISNPLPGSKRQAWFPVKDFLYAVHASTTKEIDNGTLLAVWK